MVEAVVEAVVEPRLFAYMFMLSSEMNSANSSNAQNDRRRFSETFSKTVDIGDSDQEIAAKTVKFFFLISY